MSDEEDDSIARKFREYSAAIADKETATAAELYANYSEDEEFIRLVQAYHKTVNSFVDGYRNGQRKSAIEFLKKELYMSDMDIVEMEERFEGTEATIITLVAALKNVHKSITKSGTPMSFWDIHMLLQQEGFWDDLESK